MNETRTYGTGEEHPLFLIYCCTEEHAYARALAMHIEPEIPVCGFAVKKAMDGHQLRTVEGIAERMMGMIRAVQALGPYRIAACGFGGILAYEIATQLIGDDQSIAFLGLLNTTRGVVGGISPESPLDANNDRLPFQRQQIAGGDEPQFATTAIAPSSTTAESTSCRAELSPVSIRPHQDSEDVFYRAQRLYRPQPISIPIHLFGGHDRDRSDLFREFERIHIRMIESESYSTCAAADVKLCGQALLHAIRDGDQRKLTLPENSYNPLSPLVIGRRNDIPLFCVPGAGASVTSFQQLASSLEVLCPIYGMEPRGLDGVLVPHSTVAAAAGCYLQAIDEIYPKGPFHLLGHSFGGWIVFEMAQRMRQIGRPILSLTILDSDVPDDARLRREYTPTETILKLVELFEDLVDHSLEIGPSDLDSRNEAAQLKLVHERLVRFGLVPRKSRPEVLRGPLRTFSACTRSRYTPNSAYTGFGHLIMLDDPKLTTKANSREQQNRIEGWKRWAPNLVCLHGPGNHMTALKPPHVHVLAKMLTSAWASIPTSGLVASRVDSALSANLKQAPSEAPRS